MSGNVRRVLIVDDEESLCSYLSVVLQKAGYEVTTATSGADGLEAARAKDFGVVLHDLCMPEMDGIAFLKQLRRVAPDAVPVLMTAYSSWDSAVAAMRLGAFNYIRKPFDNEEIRQIVARAMEGRRCRAQADWTPINLIGNTPPMREIQSLVTRVGRTDSTVLILGESGTGKEVVARGLHQSSTRAEGKFVAVNCGAFPEGLLESELFGHVKGSFTGAAGDKRGLFEEAGGGTFFLDEVGEMPRSTQVKLLRALEERCIKPVGSVESRPVDVRVIAATNRDLRAEVAEGHFREDLFYRLNVIPIHLPPLRERTADIPLLVGHLMSRNARRGASPVGSISQEALEALMSYSWPGNIRELDNVIQRAMALCAADCIGPGDVVLGAGVAATAPQASVEDESSADAQSASSGERIDKGPATLAAPAEIPEEGIDLEEALSQYERSLIQKALDKSYGSLKDTAALLKVNYRQLRYRVEKLGLKRD